MDAVKPPLPLSEFKTILEGLLFGLDLISFLLGIFLFFAIAQLWQEERTIEEQEENPRNRAALLKWRQTLLIVAGLSLLAAHVLIRVYPALPPPFEFFGPTPAWALIAGLSFMMIYYRGLGMHLKGADAAQYSLILWAATWVMAIWILFFLYWLDKEQELISLTNLDSASFAHTSIPSRKSQAFSSRRPWWSLLIDAMPVTRTRPRELRYIRPWNLNRSSYSDSRTITQSWLDLCGSLMQYLRIFQPRKHTV
jgi:hypothetical protein